MGLPWRQYLFLQVKRFLPKWNNRTAVSLLTSSDCIAETKTLTPMHKHGSNRHWLVLTLWKQGTTASSYSSCHPNVQTQQTGNLPDGQARCDSGSSPDFRPPQNKADIDLTYFSVAHICCGYSNCCPATLLCEQHAAASHRSHGLSQVFKEGIPCWWWIHLLILLLLQWVTWPVLTLSWQLS